MSVIERAEKRLAEEERQHELGADNRYDLHYWAAYLDGARAQKKEGGELAMSALNYVERQGFMTGMGYAEMTAEEREALLKELRNLPVGPVAPLVVEHDYAKMVKALRDCASGDDERCFICTYHKASNMPCDNALMTDAAAAIEALQAELAGSKDAIRILKQNLEMKKPKRGEWAVREVDIPGEIHPVAFRCMCSMCRNEYVFQRIPQYCPDCGSMNTAKMEVQDADT